MTNGWRDGKDPAQRWLRILAGVCSLGVFVYLEVDPSRGPDDIPAVALALGALLILLGYERLVRLPGISRDESDRQRGAAEREEEGRDK